MYQFKNEKSANRRAMRFFNSLKTRSLLGQTLSEVRNVYLRQNEFNNNYAILEYSLANCNVIVPFFSFYLNKCILNIKKKFILKRSIRNIRFTMNSHKHC